jgi:phytoene dehydrogenase-like protein
MYAKSRYDAVIVGAGPNGLAAAITLARAGRSVLVLEAKDSVGGGTRTAELTLPGFKHDVCSAIHPLSLGSPFMRSLPLEEYGVEWIYPPAAIAHPLDDSPAVLVERSVEATAAQLGGDAGAYRRLMDPLVAHGEAILEDLLGPFPLPPHHPVQLIRFGLSGLRSASGLARSLFREERARAVFSGIAAHSMLPIDEPGTAAFGLIMAILAHSVGWPMARGGSQTITQAMAAYLLTLGGEIVTGCPVSRMAELPEAHAILFDLTPRQLLSIAGSRLPSRYRQQLTRYRYGPGVFKLDYALAGPIPWKDPECARAATVHLGGTLEEIVASERGVWQNEPVERPYVLLVQQSLFDPSRAPQGKHTAWAYCHVPHASQLDMTGPIEAQIERFAPGFRDLVLARHSMNTAEMESYNPNYVGGDINGGVQDLRQLFTRPVARWVPYSTPDEHIFICSSSTPPGGGVHGMCGFFAAQAVLKKSVLKQ